jgi:RimJ/RimL family protein N-acetyltransferase
LDHGPLESASGLWGRHCPASIAEKKGKLVTWPAGYIKFPKLEMSDGDIAIRPLRFDDRESIRSWRNDQMDVLRQCEPLTESEQEDYFNKEVRLSMLSESPDQILLGMEEGNHLVAYGGLVNISWINRRAELSFLAATQLQSDKYENYFSVFVNFVFDQAHNELGIHRIFTETYAFRRDHISLIERFGFKLEGRLVDHNYGLDGFFDSIVHGVILV